MERLAFSERNSLILRKENNKVGLWPWGGKMKDLCLNYYFFLMKYEVKLSAVRAKEV